MTGHGRFWRLAAGLTRPKPEPPAKAKATADSSTTIAMVKATPTGTISSATKKGAK